MELANYYNIFVFIHVISASAFVMNMIIMQLVFSNAMKRFPDSEDKKKATAFIHKKWHPIVDIIIILVGLSAALMAISAWERIASNHILLTKLATGSIALLSAYISHFILKPIRDKRSGNERKKIARIMQILSKAALIFGTLTALLGWFFNHRPF